MGGVEAIDLEGLQVGVDQPQVSDTGAGIAGHFEDAVGAGGGGGEDFAHPVRRQFKPGGIGQTGHAFAAPAGQIGHEHVVAEM